MCCASRSRLAAFRYSLGRRLLATATSCAGWHFQLSLIHRYPHTCILMRVTVTHWISHSNFTCSRSTHSNRKSMRWFVQPNGKKETLIAVHYEIMQRKFYQKCKWGTKYTRFPNAYDFTVHSSCYPKWIDTCNTLIEVDPFLFGFVLCAQHGTPLIEWRRRKQVRVAKCWNSL